MIAQLTSLALMIAALLLVLSLPLGEGDAGRALRRAAGFAFVMAFVPATLACLFAPLFRRGHSPAAFLELLLAAFGVIGVLVIVSLAAYGLLHLRNSTGGATLHAPGTRYAKRRPDEHHHDDGDHV
jgi:hypothetical protein